MIPARRPRRVLVLRLLAGALVLAVVLGGAAYLWERHRTANVSNPSVVFETQPVVPAKVVAPPPRAASAFLWPVYGFSPARTRSFPLNITARPPFKAKWAVRGNELLEFSPVAGGGSIYILTNNGALYAIKRSTGYVLWKRKLGDLAASSPAYRHGTVFMTLLQGAGSAGGRVTAVSVQFGNVLWSKPLPSRSESSPLVVGDSLYFGSENGTVYCLRAKDGHVRWTTKVGGAVKAGLAYDRGKLFFGDYSGQMHAIDATSGRKIWSVGTSGKPFGLGSGGFYATPSVAFGRVYAGNTDGSVYSFSERDGALAWRTGTGSYVYSSAAVDTIPGLGPTVYVGSYDSRVYAIDARSGRVRWRHSAEGRISGGLQLVGDLLFYSTLNRHTTALGAATGRQIWSVPKGKFNPVISDGRYLFLNGQTSLFAYDLRPGTGPVKTFPGDRPKILPSSASARSKSD